MSSDNASLHSTLSKFLEGMNLPDYKRDTEKPTNVVWLLQNLKTKNNRSIHYMQTMLLLCTLAERMNLLKAKEIKAIRESFERRSEERRMVNKTTSFQQVPKGQNLYPHQKQAIEALKAKAQVVTSFL